MSKNKKVFVIDTNVVLHDYSSIYNFQEHDVVIPIVVLEELDRMKKGNDIINFNAREFTRELDKVSGDNLFNGGISLGKGRGKLSIETGKAFSDKLLLSFPEDSPDHRILAITEFVQKKHEKKPVILVTKDINLRMKAKSLGIMSEDYKTDKVVNLDVMQKSIQILENFPENLIGRLYNAPEGIPVGQFKLRIKPLAHQYFIFRNNSLSVLAHFEPVKKVIERVEKTRCYGIEPRNAEQAFSLHALANDDIQLVALTGKAGTGKTLLALAAALHQERKYEQILLARPTVPLGNRDMGFLPGDIDEKIGPYMTPLYDNLAVIKRKYSQQSREFQKVEEMQRDQRMTITPLAYIRGRSLSNVFFIVDEAQNLTPHEVKTIITRAGESTKVVFTGDIQQIDSPYLDSLSNGLSYLADKMKGQDIFSHVNLVKGERSYLAELASNLL